MSAAFLSSQRAGSWVESRMPVWSLALDIFECCWDSNMDIEAISEQRKYCIFYLFFCILHSVAGTILMILQILTYLNLLNSWRQIFFLLLLSNLFYCGKNTYHEVNLLNKLLSVQYSIVDHRAGVLILIILQKRKPRHQ